MKLRQSGKTALLALVALLAPVLAAQDLKSLQPQGYVSDFAAVIDPTSRAQLEEYCSRVEQATGVQMALVTVKSLNDQPIEDAANALFRRWGVGKKGQDEGLLLLIAVQDHKDRIEVGYGLEPILPDGFVGSILRTINPYLAQGNYSQGMLAAAQEMGSRIAQSKGVTLDFGLRQPRPMRTVRSRGGGFPWTLVIIGLVFLFSILGRGGRGGGGGGFLTGMILGNVLGRSGGGWGGGGGFGGGSGGGGGGFGGFGGGDSGGGGASGSW